EVLPLVVGDEIAITIAYHDRALLDRPFGPLRLQNAPARERAASEQCLPAFLVGEPLDAQIAKLVWFAAILQTQVAAAQAVAKFGVLRNIEILHQAVVEHDAQLRPVERHLDGVPLLERSAGLLAWRHGAKDCPARDRRWLTIAGVV